MPLTITKDNYGYELLYVDNHNKKLTVRLSNDTKLLRKDDYTLILDGYFYSSDITFDTVFEKYLTGKLYDSFGCYILLIVDHKKNNLTITRDSLGLYQIYVYKDKNNYYLSYNIKNFKKIYQLDIEINVLDMVNNPWFSGIPRNDLENFNIFKNVVAVDSNKIIEFSLQDTLDYNIFDKYSCQSNKLQDYGIEDIQRAYISYIENAFKNFNPSSLILLLSGGIDSVTVGKLLLNNNINYNTLSLLSESTLSNGDVDYSCFFCDIYNISGNYLQISEDRPLLSTQEYKYLLTICESPFIGAEQIYKYLLYFSAKKEFPNVEFIATGQGSDEFNGGYSSTTGNTWNEFNDFIEYLQVHSDIPGSFIWTERFQRNIFRSTDNSFKDYIEGKMNNFSYYGIWNEVRIANHFGLKIFSPFLHRNFYNLLMEVPKKFYSNLYFDKNILRQFAKNTGIDSRLTERKKVPFFHGKKVNVTYENIFKIINQNSRKLVDEAFLDENLKKYISYEKINEILDEMEENQDFSNIEYILKILNIGLLNTIIDDEYVFPISNVDTLNLLTQGELLVEIKNKSFDDYELELSKDSEILFSWNQKKMSILKNGTKFLNVNNKLDTFSS